ncbi:MAG: hypothetical protein EHM35_01210 [Planctomycetaceae bacterium]|nr:MAG: hypothetical protein EHM35_01210 [Planctomycetaceae bacterium]
MILRLTGPLAGQTIRLNGRQFVGGRLELKGDPRSCRMIANYYVTCYEVEVDGDKSGKNPSETETILLGAIASVPKDEWVRDDDGPAHPKVAAIAERIGNYHLTKEQIIEVMQKWPLPS